MSIFTTFKNMSSSLFGKRILWILLVCLVLSSSILFFRSCSHKKISHKDIYYFGRDSSWYPLEVLGREKNLQAFTNDLMALIAKETELRFVWIETSPSVLFYGLDNGTYDAIISSTRPDVVNQERHSFSALLFGLGPVLIVRQDSNITSLKEMRGKSIGVTSGATTTFNAIRERGANVYDFILIIYNNINKAVEALVNNQIDGIVISALPAYTLTHGFYAGKLKVVTAPLTDEGLRMVSLKNAPSELLINEINSVLKKLKENGTYDALITKWSLIDTEKQFWHHQNNDMSLENSK